MAGRGASRSRKHEYNCSHVQQRPQMGGTGAFGETRGCGRRGPQREDWAQEPVLRMCWKGSFGGRTADLLSQKCLGVRAGSTLGLHKFLYPESPCTSGDLQTGVWGVRLFRGQ